MPGRRPSQSVPSPFSLGDGFTATKPVEGRARGTPPRGARPRRLSSVQRTPRARQSRVEGDQSRGDHVQLRAVSSAATRSARAACWPLPGGGGRTGQQFSTLLRPRAAIAGSGAARRSTSPRCHRLRARSTYQGCPARPDLLRSPSRSSAFRVKIAGARSHSPTSMRSSGLCSSAARAARS